MCGTQQNACDGVYHFSVSVTRMMHLEIPKCSGTYRAHAQVVLCRDEHAGQAVAGGLRYPQQQPVRGAEGGQVAAVEHEGGAVVGRQCLAGARALPQRRRAVLACIGGI